MSAAKKEESKRTFEDSFRRLEKIVGDLEGGTIPLDESIRLYEEGIALSKECLQHLNRAEGKLKRLTRDLEGSFDITEEEEG